MCRAEIPVSSAAAAGAASRQRAAAAAVAADERNAIAGNANFGVRGNQAEGGQGAALFAPGQGLGEGAGAAGQALLQPILAAAAAGGVGGGAAGAVAEFRAALQAALTRGDHLVHGNVPKHANDAVSFPSFFTVTLEPKLDVRSAPNATASVVRSLPTGSVVFVLNRCVIPEGVDSLWLQVCVDANLICALTQLYPNPNSNHTPHRQPLPQPLTLILTNPNPPI